jgi:hypothetical protein
VTAKRLRFASTGRDVAAAKATADAAYRRARASGALAPVLIDRLWADTLMLAEGKPPETAAEMLRRTQHVFVLLEDRATWA